jgi:5-methylcytosine-specific restriction enzyme subunit McrC
LHRAYRERREQGAVLQGRLDLTAQLREAPGRKEQLHGRVDDLSVDIPCNRIPRATAELLLASPLIGANVQAALRQALVGFGQVSSTALSPSLWEEIRVERLPDDYVPLLDFCRLLTDSLTPDCTSGNTVAPSFLLNLEQVFERHITRGIREAFVRSERYTITIQQERTVNHAAADLPDVTIRPDLTIDAQGRVVLIVDAKWKRLEKSPDTPDLYQMLAYGTTLGVKGIVLVYPGRRWSARDYRFTNTPLWLSVCTLRVQGSREECARSVKRLGSWLKALLR